MDWANILKIYTPPSVKRYFPPTSMCCTKKKATRNGELWKVIADMKTTAQDKTVTTAAPLLLANKSTV